MADRDDIADTGRQSEEPSSTTADENEIRELLRGALVADERPVPDVLRGVQRKLRERSQGKFYADGWSTLRQPPIQTYLVTSVVMLAIALFVYALLRPLSGTGQVVEPPAPIRVVPPTLLPSARP